jgi:hypothetical protein
MLTYGNTDFIAKHMVSQLGKKYENQVSAYLSKGPTSSYPKEKDWMQKRFPPSGETLRLAYFEAESSKLQPYGYSNRERYNHELQSVNIEDDDIIAYDHTFQVIKNYSLKGAKALFTGIKGKTKEIVSAFIVPTSTRVSIAVLGRCILVGPQPKYSDKIQPHMTLVQRRQKSLYFDAVLGWM